MDLDKAIADAQALVDSLNAIKAAMPVTSPVNPEDSEIDVVRTDGSVSKWVPKVE